jgi:hypothetical protein
MRKGWVLSVLFIISILAIISFVQAADKDFENMTESQRVNLAYDCLDEVVENKTCEELTPTEMIYSLLSVSECESELLDEAKDDECWPKTRCDVKTTAQAVLALDKAKEDTDKPVEWILEQTQVPTDLIWYLEVESRNESICSVTYSDRAYEFTISEDKKLASGNLGSCLSLSANGNYWLQVNPSCYELEYSVSCDQSFLTTLLFKNPEEETIHVLDKIHSAPEEGTTVEKINSFCFSGAAGCDYEATLWATMVLDKLGEDITSFVPYLITGEKDNREYFPAPFLYYITGYSDYSQDLLDRQINEQYWQVSNTKYLDTAIALLPFQTEELEEKTNTINWLMDIQQENGCWDGENIVSNGALLYSIWPRGYMGSGSSGDIIDDDDNVTSDNDCVLSGNYCLNSGQCDGDILTAYSSSCTGITICCDTPAEIKTCEVDLSGEICNSNEYCSTPGTEKRSDDLLSGQTCCVGGECKVTVSSGVDENACEDNFGLCEEFSCGSGYQETTSLTCSGGKTCCIPTDEPEKASKWWIWVLFILIVLVVIAIIYRDKIKELVEDMQKKGGPSSNSRPSVFPGRPGFPPSSSSRPGFPTPRKIVPQSRPMPSRPMNSPRPINPAIRPRPKSPQELDDVLKKLKDMSN